MEGLDQIKKHVEEIETLLGDINHTRDIVAHYANTVDTSIHANERKIHAREAVRRIDFARELLALAASTMEQVGGGWEREIPLLREAKNIRRD